MGRTCREELASGGTLIISQDRVFLPGAGWTLWWSEGQYSGKES